MLLRRNAGLRKLVADEVTVPDELVERLHEQAYGEQVQIRLITVPTLKQAEAVRRRLAAGELFSDIAVDVSTDASGARGGLLPPISRHATVLPDAMVKVAWSEPVGRVSDPIALEGGFALVRVERRIPAQPTPLAEVRDELRDLAREQQTQRLMQREARALMDAADVTVLDAALDDAWQRQRRAIAEPTP
jgi:foldase protein PrsA